MSMAPGAPLGWLSIRWGMGVPPLLELARSPILYLYMLIATTLVFGIFGFLLGEREDRLLAANHNLELLALTDSLTGLRNARYFRARLEEVHAGHERSGRPLGLAVLDIDHFKRINDEYGHQVGDRVLESVGRAIASVTREGETEARVGGEEFALLLPDSTGRAAAEVAERVREAMGAAETMLDGHPARSIRVTASAGVASTAELPGASPHELYAAADAALYRAKAEGRDRTVVREGAMV